MPTIWNMQIGQSYNSQDTYHHKTIKSCFPIFQVSGCTTVDDGDKLEADVTHCVTHLMLCGGKEGLDYKPILSKLALGMAVTR